jgi:hypothetical protein
LARGLVLGFALALALVGALDLLIMAKIMPRLLA